nr:Gfo/Idh/MocA family oxidoreductase [uncultured Actinoplanes sp.]
MRRPGRNTVVVGAGAIAQRVHLPCLIAHEGIGRVLVMDPDERAMRRVTGIFPVEPYAGKLADVPADLAVICTPPRSHAALVRAALTAGMDVICEKPLVTSAADATELVRLAQDKGKRLFPCYTNRFRPDVQRLRDLIRTGELGVVSEVRADWSRRAGVPASAGGWESGVLWDLGSHLVDLALWCTGWAGPVTAFARGVRPGPGSATPTAGWYGAGSPSAPPAIEYATVNCLAGFAAGTLSVRASWHGAVATDSVTVRVCGSKATAELRTVFGFSPDRQTVAGPCLRVSDQDGGGWRDVIAAQPRQPDEYLIQLDEALRLRAADQSRAAIRSVALGELFTRSLSEGGAVTAHLVEEGL